MIQPPTVEQLLCGFPQLYQSVSDSQRLRPLSPSARAASPRKNLVYCVENARSAFSTQYTTSGERRRREQAIVMEVRQSLKQMALYSYWEVTSLFFML